MYEVRPTRFPRVLTRFLTCVLGSLLALAVLSGCRLGPGPGRSATDGESAAGPSYGKVFLDRNECSSRGPDPREVRCSADGAAARVLARHVGGREPGAVCPAATDFLLRVSESRPAADEDGDGVVTRGYACMRNLQAPHPGDPGRGGGPHTVVGDCVYRSHEGEVRETACRTPGGGPGERARKPEFRVVTAVAERSLCPPSTTLYVQLDGIPDARAGNKPVGCARRL